MLKQIFYPGLLAGVLAGMFIFGAQQMKLVPLIVEAESYENTAGNGHHGTEKGAAHDHAEPAANNTAPQATESTVHVHDNGQRHVHGDGDEWAPGDGIERTAFSLLSNVLTAVGFGLVLAGAMAISRRKIPWKEGVIWGLAGYVAVHLSPAFGLPPELPGMAGEADLIARQTWSMSTTLVTILGLAMIGLSKHWGFKIAGVVAIALPHIIGLQGRVHVDHAVPADLVAEFIVATLVITALFWALLGGLTSYFSGRFSERNA